jgi:hypothetical protein
MRFGISIPADDIGIANSPEIGGESKVKLSYSEIGTIGQIVQTAPASGGWTAEIPAFDFTAPGVDLALVADTGIKSSVNIVVDLNVTFDDDSSGTARATFAVPSFAKDQSANLPIGLAVDIIGQVAGNSDKKIKAVAGISSITGGAKGNKFSVVSLPSEWFDLGCARSKNEQLPVPKSLPIPCGLKGSAFNKAGRSEPGQLELNALNFTYGDGLNRLNGHRGSVLVQVYKDGRVLTEQTVYGGYRATPSTDRGDGDDEVTNKATGNFEAFAKFV